MLKIRLIDALAEKPQAKVTAFEEEVAEAIKDGWTPKYSTFKVIPESEYQDKTYAILLTKEE